MKICSIWREKRLVLPLILREAIGRPLLFYKIRFFLFIILTKETHSLGKRQGNLREKGITFSRIVDDR